MPASNAEPTTWVFTKTFGFGRVAQPNESRLSCGAKLKCSQTEFYHAVLQDGWLGKGAASFKRWLGCAPQLFAEILP